MLIAHVHIKVKPDHVEAFKQATLENARNSIREKGIARFDVIQSDEDLTRFVLMEAYCSAEDQLTHKDTAHFRKWVETVEEMMAEPRRALKFSNVFPDDHGWSTEDQQHV